MTPDMPWHTHGALQRARITRALVDLLEQTPLTAVTVSAIISRAGISRKTFYDHFRDREDCYLAAFDHATRSIGLTMLDAYSDQHSWRSGTRAALRALLVELDRDRGRARLCVTDTGAAGVLVQRRRSEILDVLAVNVDRGRLAPDAAAPAPAPLTAEGLVGATMAVIHARLTDPDAAPLSTLVDPLMSMIVLPYLGPGAAHEEMSRPKPRRGTPPDEPARGAPLPVPGVNVRLTYRTVRVLGAIARTPGASNRQVADDAGITDQGQISKLLHRLARGGLIVNDGGEEPHSPNAWSLTPLGERIHSSTRPA